MPLSIAEFAVQSTALLLITFGFIYAATNAYQRRFVRFGLCLAVIVVGVETLLRVIE